MPQNYYMRTPRRGTYLPGGGNYPPVGGNYSPAGGNYPLAGGNYPPASLPFFPPPGQQQGYGPPQFGVGPQGYGDQTWYPSPQNSDPYISFCDGTPFYEYNSHNTQYPLQQPHSIHHQPSQPSAQSSTPSLAQNQTHNPPTRTDGQTDGMEEYFSQQGDSTTLNEGGSLAPSAILQQENLGQDVSAQNEAPETQAQLESQTQSSVTTLPESNTGTGASSQSGSTSQSENASTSQCNAAPIQNATGESMTSNQSENSYGSVSTGTNPPAANPQPSTSQASAANENLGENNSSQSSPNRKQSASNSSRNRLTLFDNKSVSGQSHNQSSANSSSNQSASSSNQSASSSNQSASSSNQSALSSNQSASSNNQSASSSNQSASSNNQSASSTSNNQSASSTSNNQSASSTSNNQSASSLFNSQSASTSSSDQSAFASSIIGSGHQIDDPAVVRSSRSEGETRTNLLPLSPPTVDQQLLGETVAVTIDGHMFYVNPEAQTWNTRSINTRANNRHPRGGSSSRSSRHQPQSPNVPPHSPLPRRQRKPLQILDPKQIKWPNNIKMVEHNDGSAETKLVETIKDLQVQFKCEHLSRELKQMTSAPEGTKRNSVLGGDAILQYMEALTQGVHRCIRQKLEHMNIAPPDTGSQSDEENGKVIDKVNTKVTEVKTKVKEVNTRVKEVKTKVKEIKSIDWSKSPWGKDIEAKFKVTEDKGKASNVKDSDRDPNELSKKWKEEKILNTEKLSERQQALERLTLFLLDNMDCGGDTVEVLDELAHSATYRTH